MLRFISVKKEEKLIKKTEKLEKVLEKEYKDEYRKKQKIGLFLIISIILIARKSWKLKKSSV
ncbi:hypothetical protein A3E06_01555 [Candidatus Giovannonibacteria bacterium RIFCSPHIGHO2_12_FULL_44_42]|nr:MAG: hypothetical protein A3E06_01555 [Candidatus Giovannonibacteria bacterium RIFCSPHIGHO2_12_FULL_44_42]OGF89852.1 MAG: hypothetical protein A3I94_02645 [Candidatus Giovannonibacteria bacterium RIFCSPLOWO2_02_FULL_43_54]OGF96694.1 MAG: hypothetical protein A3H08_02225 [Candidatus Giovannonibacteria bacterium RIFCSPLOWO2_12_FULL_44_32]